MVETVAAALITNVMREKEIVMMMQIAWLDIVEEITAMDYLVILMFMMTVAKVRLTIVCFSKTLISISLERPPHFNIIGFFCQRRYALDRLAVALIAILVKLVKVTVTIILIAKELVSVEQTIATEKYMTNSRSKMTAVLKYEWHTRNQ